MPSVIVHGHFYQPPRENAWSGEPEPEPSAAPAHDWNERINAECYRANAWARIHGPDGRILDLVNTYAWMSFNFGPTLAAWLEKHDPATYARILDADRRSRARTGHGNAMAQAYNHAILPLCNDRDRRTQVRWGVDDFTRRFRRRPEGMWLPECAVDYPTLDALAEAGIKFTILAPEQAAAEVDPSVVYRCRGVAIFFYDGPVSREISFGEVSKNGEALASRLASERALTLAATDGEVYGHHKKFADLTLAYVLTRALPGRNIEVTNPGAYLARHRQTPWVALKPGGSSWSCAHGIERWRKHCGCSTGGPPSWNQKWRAPLREAFDWLRDRLASQFEGEGRKYFADPWAARDRYLTAKPKARRALELLEAQRHAMLMYTSCGWFFSDLAGLEVGLVMQHAFRAIELSGLKLERAFLNRLKKARSNQPGRPDGATLARERVLPRRRAAGPDARETRLKAALEAFEPPEFKRAVDPAVKEAATRWATAQFSGRPTRAACRAIAASLEGVAFDPVIVQNAFFDWIRPHRVAAHDALRALAERLGMAL